MCRKIFFHTYFSVSRLKKFGQHWNRLLKKITKETHECPLFKIQRWKLDCGLDRLGKIFHTSSITADLALAVRHFAVFIFLIQLTEGEPLECPPVFITLSPTRKFR